MKLGATTWFTSLMDPEAVFRMISAKGYEAVELAGTKEILNWDYKDLRRMLQKLSLDLTCLSVGVPFARDPSKLNLHSQRPSIRLDSLKYVYACMDCASQIGAKFVYVCSIVKEEVGQSGSDAFSTLKESLGKCAAYGERLGIAVALEPFPWGLCPSIQETFHLVRQVPGVWLVFDTGHEVLCRHPLNFPLTNASLILDVHINNNDGVSDKHWSPEKGVIQRAEYVETIKQLRSTGYKGNLTVELLNIEDGSELSSSRKFIESLVPG